jgi:hypothetical protein
MPKPPLPKDKFKGKQGVIRMTEKEYNYLMKKANKSNKTFSQFVRDALVFYIKNEKDTITPLF